MKVIVLGRLSFVAALEPRRHFVADASAPKRPDDGPTPVARVSLRYASAADRERLRYLAELDSAAAPQGSVLVAEVDGRLRAALPLDGSPPIADPFQRGAELAELLALRAAQLGRR